MAISPDNMRNTGEDQSGSSDSSSIMAALQSGFSAQLRLYGEMYDLARDLTSAISEEDHQRIVQIIAHKQERVAALTEIQNDLAPCKEIWARIRDGVPEEDKGPLKRKLDEVGEMLMLLLNLEKANEDALAMLTQRTQEELMSTQKQRQAYTAYSLEPPKVKPKFLDQKS